MVLGITIAQDAIYSLPPGVLRISSSDRRVPSVLWDPVTGIPDK
jgi:hypothetical protein